MKQVAQVAIFSYEGDRKVPQRKLRGFTSVQRAKEAIAELAEKAVASISRVGVFDPHGHPIH